MSSPDRPHQPDDAARPAESSSLMRWLIASAIIVLLAVGVGIGVTMLPTEEGNSLTYKIPTKPKGPPGKVVLSEDATYKFDVMPQNTKGSHPWKFTNGGVGDLELSLGPHDCSCTIANLPDEKSHYTLKPNETIEVKLTWDTKVFDGKFRKTATINVLGDPEREQVVFAVDGTIKPAVTVAPPERIIAFGSFPNDQSVKGEFAIGSADKPDLKILSLTSSRPEEIVLTLSPLSEQQRQSAGWTSMKGGHLIQVEVKPSKSLGPFGEEVIATTDHPLVKEIRLSVSGKRVGPIAVVPETARMHQVNSAEGAATTVMITVRNAPETKFEVLEVPDYLKVEITPADVKVGSAAKIRQYRMTVTVPPETPAGKIEGAIVLKSDHPLADRVKIPVEITVLSGQ
ncbi:MAG: hypothetical protein JWN86_4264 [Planctomycetota bacterium]|nr:hypothetical protein [Planctomycetota bacterium]